MKDEGYWRVLDGVIRLEVTKGHLRWKVTELSRLSRVGRPLIYYYFGKSKEQIVQAALKIIGDEFFGLSAERSKMWEEGRILESIQKTRDLLKKAPHVSEFYFFWRHQPGEISDHLKLLEKRYRKKLELLKPGRAPAEIDAIFAILFGLVLLPDLSDKALAGVVDRIREFLSTK